MKTTKLPTLANAAFSLVEVTLAMGIAALGIIAVLGLMPQGMEMSRKTGELTARRQILEQIVNDLSQKEWTDLLSYSTGAERQYFYDDQGLATLQSAPTQALVANVSVTHTGSRLPAGAADQQYLMKVVVKVATTTDPNFDFGDGNRNNYVTTSHYLAKTR